MTEVSDADRIKLSRSSEPVPLDGVSKPGGKPRPIRKKAFWRALKRGELWAIVPYEHFLSGGICLNIGANHFARVIPDMYCPVNTAYAIWPTE